MITAVPKTYRGVTFRSTLEADWAVNLDALGIVWQYEPEAVRLPSDTLYRPDFYLPVIATWLEVKGAHGERVDKTDELRRAVYTDCSHDVDSDGLCDYGCRGEHQIVITGLAAISGRMDWAGDYRLQQCATCADWWWLGDGAYGCRAHRRHGGGDQDLDAPSYTAASFDWKQARSFDRLEWLR